MNFAFEIRREVYTIGTECSHHIVMGTFGTNRINSVGRMVKVKDRMRWGFAPARVRFPPCLKCKIHHRNLVPMIQQSLIHFLQLSLLISLGWQV